MPSSETVRKRLQRDAYPLYLYPVFFLTVKERREYLAYASDYILLSSKITIA